MIYVTGDTHSSVIERISKNNCLKHKLPLLEENDILIVLGDLGVVWSKDSYKQIKYINQYLKRRGIKIYSVLGNHENYDIINNLPVVNHYGGKCYKISDNMYFLKNGELFNMEENKLAVFGGALSIDKEFRKEGKSWWSQEIPSEKTMKYFIDNLNKINATEYTLLTHTTTTSMIKYLLFDNTPKIDKVSNFLENIKINYNFKNHYFGHMHNNLNLPDKSVLLYNNIIALGDIN